MLTRKKHGKKTLSVGRIKRKQKRKPRRLVEAPPQDWERWDAAAKALGVNWSEFARRSMNQAATVLHMSGRLRRD